MIGRLRIIAPGVASSVRDAGRLGLASIGCPRGGAVDRLSLALANRLVGNPEDAPAIETSGGFVAEVRAPVIVAVTGSQAELAVEGGPPLGWGVPTVLEPGAVLRVGALRGNARCYLAVRGGADPQGWPHEINTCGLEVGRPSIAPAVPRGFDRPVRIWPGPRRDWFVADAWRLLTESTWTVSVLGDRTGVRLDGPVLERSVHRELPSEGMVEGAVQVPPDGRPIVMLADHPTTGGYPVIAVVDPVDIGLVAQRTPGTQVRFRPVGRGDEH